MIAPFDSQRYAPFRSMQAIKTPRLLRHFAWLLVGAMVVSVIFLFVTPWVQTARGVGKVTALNPAERMQHVNAMVSGRIKQWYVNDGNVVREGDPIVELIDNDSQIIERLDAERAALAESVDVATIAAETALKNYERQKDLYAQGISSEREVEEAKITYKTHRAEQAKAEARLTQAEIQLARQQTQRVVAPRDGTIVSIVAGDVATTIKAGERLATLAPTDVPPAVELFVDGLDISLMYPGRKVRLQFEGWPAVQFSGWPSVAIGTFGGMIHAVDPAVSPNGKFRVLVVPDPDDAAWPERRFLPYGAKVKGWVLLDTVSAGYEIWRHLNNFPPRFDQNFAPRLQEPL